MQTTTIEFSSANREFDGEIIIGQYVAWWTAEDGQSSLQMTIGSYHTAEEAISAAQSECTNQGIEGGKCEAAQVVADK